MANSGDDTSGLAGGESMGNTPSENPEPPEMIHRQSTKKTYSKTYTKTFWHYVSNNPDYTGTTTKVDSDGRNQLVMDFGAQYVPYDNCRIAMRYEDWHEGWHSASAFRVKKHAVKISDYTPIQENLNATINQIQTQFVKDPALWIYTDPQRYFTTKQVIPIDEMENLYSANNFYRRQIPN